MNRTKWTDYRDEIIGFIEEKLLYGERFPISDEDSLREEGIVDSTGIFDLMAFIESKYRVTIDDNDMVPENFDCIAAICEMVSRKVGCEKSEDQTSK